MNTRNQARSGSALLKIQFTGLAALLLAVMLLAGCTSAGYVKSDRTAWSAQHTATAVRAESKALRETTATLNGLVDLTSGDLRQHFQRFDRALDELGACKKRVQSAAGRLAQRSTAYFQAWGKQLPAITDEQLRKESLARKEEVANQYQTTTRQHQEAQNALASLIAYLQDIRKALSADLTLSGLHAVKPTVRNANEMAGKVEPQLAQSANDLDALGVRMSSLIGPSPK